MHKDMKFDPSPTHLPAIDYTAIGLRIRACRKQKKMTQADVARATGRSLSFIGHVERGARVPSIETMLHIATVLGVPVDALLTGVQSPAERPTCEMVRTQIFKDIVCALNAYMEGE